MIRPQQTKLQRLIDAIYVQTRNENTDEQCAAAKAAWDKLTDAQKELVEGENADPGLFRKRYRRCIQG